MRSAGQDQAKKNPRSRGGFYGRYWARSIPEPLRQVISLQITGVTSRHAMPDSLRLGPWIGPRTDPLANAASTSSASCAFGA